MQTTSESFSCFTLRHLMTSWRLHIWKVKIWLSQERKSLRSEIKKIFFLVSKVLSSRHKKQASKNVTDTTFKGHAYLNKPAAERSRLVWVPVNFNWTPDTNGPTWNQNWNQWKRNSMKTHPRFQYVSKNREK